MNEAWASCFIAGDEVSLLEFMFVKYSQRRGTVPHRVHPGMNRGGPIADGCSIALPETALESARVLEFD